VADYHNCSLSSGDLGSVYEDTVVMYVQFIYIYHPQLHAASYYFSTYVL